MTIVGIILANPLLTSLSVLFLYVVGLGAYKLVKDWLPW